jgi:drug/metabolite transporter (DMT)-like permease
LPRADEAIQATVILAALGGFAFVSYLCFQYGMKHLNTHQAVLILSAELVIAAVSSWLIANETMSLRAWVGGTMIIAAGLISSRWGD